MGKLNQILKEINSSVKMVFSWSCLTAIAFCLGSVVVQSYGEFVILRHPLANNGTTRELTCMSEDDDAALIWNYNYEASSSKSGQIIFTDFQPKKPTQENNAECAMWDSKRCLAQWEETSKWKRVESAIEPMGPVFDYRWEEFQEFIQGLNIQEQGYRYVGQVKGYSGTVVFSVRGPRDVHIFLCQNKEPTKGPCLWIIIGGWNGTRSAIRARVSDTPEDTEFRKNESFVEVAFITHTATDVVDAHEWRTFTLQWNGDQKKVEIFKDNRNKPFLKGNIDKWHLVPHMSIRSDIATRVRFHFYEYFRTEKKNAVLSTNEFYQDDKNFCVNLLVGLCPECQLNFIIMDSEGREIPIKTISGEKKSLSVEVLAWRSIRLNTSLTNLKSRIIKLKMLTILTEDGVEVQWGIDNFRECKLLGELRESSITIHRAGLDSKTYSWPKVTCQKLSYTVKTVIDSLSNSTYSETSRKHLYRVTPEGSTLTINTHRDFQTGRDLAVNRSSVPVKNAVANESKIPGTQMNATPFTQFELSSLSELLLSRKARQSSNTTPLDQAELEVYDYNAESNLISLRLSPVHYGDDVIDSYEVYISEMSSTPAIQKFEVSDGKLHCKLWDNAICFEDLTVSINDTNRIEAKVRGFDGGEPRGYWRMDILAADFANKPAGKPSYLNFTNLGNGIVKLKWPHPLLTYTKIKLFKIFIEFNNTKLQESVDQSPMTKEYPVMYEEKEYSTELYLLTSSDYFISVAAINLSNKNGTAVKENISVVSGVAFLKGEKLQVTHKRIMVNVKVPTVENATDYTFITFIVRGPLTCDFSALSKQHVNSATQKMKWKAAVFQVNETVPKNLMISANDNYNSEYNCSLHLGNNYVIEVTVEDRYKKKKSETLISDSFTLIDDKMRPRTQTQGPIWFIVVLPILAICLIALFIWHRKHKRVPKQPREPSYIEVIPLSSTRTSTDYPTTLCIDRASALPEPDGAEIPFSAHVYSVPNEPDSCCVSMEYFEEYVKKAIASGLLTSQFMLLPRGLTRPCEYGSLPENTAKNRYRNLIAYDDIRVVLEKIPGAPYSDYINASYIKGYRKERAYIAAQGPKPNTINDFWRMVWQEEVHVICMLTNVVEGTKRKCEKYWPDVGTRVKYGDFLVSNMEHQVFADYTFRTFKLSYQHDTRKVTHLHYTGWPVRGVPTHPQPLVAYLKKLLETPAGNGPVVVHCNTGDGRTGAVILCDICLRRAAAERVIDVTAVTTQMRDSRADIVGTLEQFMLAHIIITESILAIPTQIPCTEILPARIKKMKAQLPSDMQRLNDTMWQERALRSQSSTVEDVESIELPEHDPASTEHIYSNLPATYENNGNWIDPVSVDGVKMKNQYLASRLPSPFALSRFWGFVAERNIKLIIVLQRADPRDPKCCDIMPDESTPSDVPRMQVETEANLGEGNYFSVEKLVLAEGSARPQSLTVLTCKGWGQGKNGKPPPPEALVSLWSASEEIPRNEAQTLVLCHDGFTGCGLYLALSTLLERMAVQKECDVISAVRTVCRFKSEFVQSLEQCEYLYEAAETYAEYFQCYANFT